MARPFFWLTVCCLVCVVVPYGTAEEPQNPQIKQDLQLLAGTWVQVYRIEDGKTISLDKDVKVLLTMQERAFTLREGDRIIKQGTFTVTPLRLFPGLDFISMDREGKKTTALATFEVTPHQLRLCMTREGKPRPEGLTSKEGSGLILLTFQRVKP